MCHCSIGMLNTLIKLLVVTSSSLAVIVVVLLLKLYETSDLLGLMFSLFLYKLFKMFYRSLKQGPLKYLNQFVKDFDYVFLITRAT